MVGALSLSEALTSSGERCLPRLGKTVFPAREVRATLLEMLECHCSRVSSRLALGSRSERIEGRVSLGSGCAIRSDRICPLRRELLPQFLRDVAPYDPQVFRLI